jgi:hypothetical protein
MNAHALQAAYGALLQLVVRNVHVYSCFAAVDAQNPFFEPLLFMLTSESPHCYGEKKRLRACRSHTHTHAHIHVLLFWEHNFFRTSFMCVLHDATAILIIIDCQFQAFQRFSSSKLVLKTVESCFAALNYYQNGSIRYMFTCTYTQTNTYTQIHAYTQTHTYTQIHAYTQTHAYTQIHACTRRNPGRRMSLTETSTRMMYMYTMIYDRECVGKHHVCVYIYMYIYMYICVQTGILGGR